MRIYKYSWVILKKGIFFHAVFASLPFWTVREETTEVKPEDAWNTPKWQVHPSADLHNTELHDEQRYPVTQKKLAQHNQMISNYIKSTDCLLSLWSCIHGPRLSHRAIHTFKGIHITPSWETTKRTHPWNTEIPTASSSATRVVTACEGYSMQCCLRISVPQWVRVWPSCLQIRHCHTPAVHTALCHVSDWFLQL